MKKLSLVALKSDAERLVRELTFLQSVQLEPIETPPDGLPSVLPPPKGVSQSSENKNLIDTALKLTEKYRTKKKTSIELDRSRLEDKESHSEAYAGAKRVIAASAELSALSAEKDEVRKKLISLAPWKELSVNPQALETPYTRTTVGILPLNCNLDERFGGEDSPDIYGETVYTDGSRRYVSVTFMKNDENAVGTALAGLGFTRVDFDKSITCPSVSYNGLETRMAEIDKQTEDIKNEIKKLADYGEEFKLLYDSYSLDEAVEDTASGLMYTSGAVLVQAWVPEYKTEKLEEKLAEFECFYELTDPADDEEPPVLLKNNAIAAPFEAVLSLYAYPKYRAYDPTPLVAFFFSFIFGFMMQDMGYGLLLTVGCLAMIKILKPKKTFRAMLKMFAWCGLTTIFAGALFGGFFGDLPSAFAQNMLGMEAFDFSLWFSPLSDPMTMLYFSIAIGVIQVLAGIATSGVVKWKNGDIYGAIGDDFSWVITFIGAGMAFLLDGLVSQIGLYTMLLGVFMIVFMKAKGEKNPILRLGKGLVGLYSAINLASDILSYSRIMALGLSGAVIANVMNLLGTIAGPSVAGYILLVLMFVIGTALNMAISLLGAFVHSARLQYIEFFGKFYEEGGIPFKPLAPGEKYYALKAEQE